MSNKDTDALAEAYTKITEIAQKVFYDVDAEQDTYEFLKSIATQINIYRVAVAKNQEKQIRLEKYRESKNQK